MRILVILLLTSCPTLAADGFLIEQINWNSDIPATLDIAEYETHTVPSLFGVGQALANRGHLRSVGVAIDAGAGEVSYSTEQLPIWKPSVFAHYSDIHAAGSGVQYANTNGSSSLLFGLLVGSTNYVGKAGPHVGVIARSTFDISDGSRYVSIDGCALMLDNVTEVATVVALPFTGISNQASFAINVDYFSGTTRLLNARQFIENNTRLRAYGTYAHRVNNRGNFFFSAIGGVQTTNDLVEQFLDNHAFVATQFSSTDPELLKSATLTNGLHKDSVVIGSGGNARIGATFPLQDSAHTGLFYVGGSMFSSAASNIVYAGGRIRAGTGFADGKAQFIALQTEAILRARFDRTAMQSRWRQVTTWSWNAFRQVAPNIGMLRGYDYRNHAGENIANVSFDVTYTFPTAVSIGLFADAATVWNRGEQISQQRVVASVGPTIWYHNSIFGFDVDVQAGVAYRLLDSTTQVFVHTHIPLSGFVNIAANAFPFLESNSIQY